MTHKSKITPATSPLFCNCTIYTVSQKRETLYTLVHIVT